MLSIIAQTDPTVAMQSVPWESLSYKDFFLGFFIALALRRGRIEQIIDKILPMTSVDSVDTDTPDKSEDNTDKA
jgi:hypothetical protein